MNERELGKTYKDGEVICEEGEEREDMFVIQSGEVTVTKNTQGGEVAIRTLKAGEIFGEMALFDKLPRSATVKALGEARILTVDKKGFIPRVSKDPSLAFNILKSMSQRVRKLTEELSIYKKYQE